MARSPVLRRNTVDEGNTLEGSLSANSELLAEVHTCVPIAPVAVAVSSGPSRPEEMTVASASRAMVSQKIF